MIPRLVGRQQVAANVRTLETAAWLLAVARGQAKRVAPTKSVGPSRLLAGSSAPVAAGSVNGYPCGGALPSCCTLQKESGGTPTAQNPTSSSSGLWQFTDDTWAMYGGYKHAKDAPASVQNERAAIVFAGGQGASNWFGDGCYGGR